MSVKFKLEGRRGSLETRAKESGRSLDGQLIYENETDELRSSNANKRDLNAYTRDENTRKIHKNSKDRIDVDQFIRYIDEKISRLEKENSMSENEQEDDTAMKL